MKKTIKFIFLCCLAILLIFGIIWMFYHLIEDASWNTSAYNNAGYDVEKGTDLLEESLRRYCRHSKLEYMGMLAARQRSYKEAFMDEEKWQRAVHFAEKIGSVFNEGCV